MDDRRRDGGTNSTLRIKEQEMHLTLNEHDDDDDDDDDDDNDVFIFFGSITCMYYPCLSIISASPPPCPPLHWIMNSTLHSGHRTGYSFLLPNSILLGHAERNAEH